MHVRRDLPRLGQLDECARADSSSGNVIFCSTANPVGLVQKELSVAERRFGVLVDGNDDRLNVVVAPALARG